MIGRFLVLALAFGLGACASSGPEAPAAANADAVAADAPTVETTANLETQPEEDEWVCRREITTGSRMAEKVCRKRSDIERAEESGQDALRGMRKSGSQLERGESN